MSDDVGIEEKIVVDVDINIKEPSKYAVIFLNDEETPFEFVVEVLMEIFDYPKVEGILKAQEIHEKGSALIVVLSFEMADQKGAEVTKYARNNGFPLRVKIEEE